MKSKILLAMAFAGASIGVETARSAPTGPKAVVQAPTNPHPNMDRRRAPRQSDAPQIDVEQLTPAQPFKPLQTVSPKDAKTLEAKKHYIVGYANYQKNRLPDAYENFKAALAADPAFLPALRLAAPLCFQLERDQEAMEYCARALKLDPDDVDLLRLYGTQSRELGNVDAALSAFERALASPELADRLALKVELQFEVAQLYARKNQPEGVIRHLKSALEILETPNRFRLDNQSRGQLNARRLRYYELLARALRDAKRFPEARETLERARKSDARESRLTLLLAEILFDQGDFAKANEELQKFIKLQLHESQSLDLLRKILEKTGKSPEFLPTLKKIVESDKHNSERQMYYARQLIETKQYVEAEGVLAPLPGSAEKTAVLVDLYRKMRSPKRLLDQLVASFRSDGNDADGGARRFLAEQVHLLAVDGDLLGQVAAEARKARPGQESTFFGEYVVALAARERISESRKGDKVEASDIELVKEFYGRCLKQRPEILSLRIEMLETLLQNERYADVVQECEKVFMQKVADAELQLHDVFARALTMQGKAPDAIKAVENALKTVVDPDHRINGYLTLSWVHQHVKDWEKAISACKKAIDQNPESERAPMVRYMLSNVYSLKGDNAKAEEELLQLIDGDPRKIPPRVRAAANNDLGYLWADEGKNVDRAESMIRFALQITPDSAAYMDSLGWVLFKKGKYGEAAELLKKATTAEGGGDAVIWDHLGDALLQQGKREEAKKAWSKAIELYKKDTREKDGPKPKTVQEKLKLLEKSGQAGGK